MVGEGRTKGWCVSEFAGYILKIETDYILKTV